MSLRGHLFHSFVMTLVSNGITAGVGGGDYGATQDTLRQQMAVFLLRSKHGLCFMPPPCTIQVFDDVPCSLIFAPWINELVAQGITGGCARRQQLLPRQPRPAPADGRPAAADARGQRLHASGLHGRDVHRRPLHSLFGAWIYDLVGRGITAGCGGGLYCPSLSANRGQMATFITKTFNLQ